MESPELSRQAPYARRIAGRRLPLRQGVSILRLASLLYILTLDTAETCRSGTVPITDDEVWDDNDVTVAADGILKIPGLARQV